MYTSENPHFNTIDKIILGLIMFSILWILLKAFVDYQAGYGPWGWKRDEMKMYGELERKRRRRSRTPPRALRKRRVFVSDDGVIHEHDSHSSSDHSSDGYSTESEAETYRM